jgi:CheY-like chemotaxis protein
MPTAHSAQTALLEEPRRVRVLVVDDEPLLGALIARQLSGCEVTVERSAWKALTRIESGETFDRILCDVVMPGMGGREFFQQIERAHPALLNRLAFMSGGFLNDADGEWLAKLTRPLLRKPFSREELIDTLEALPI